MPSADGDRFYTSVWGDLFGHIVAYPGSVTTGRVGGTYLLTTSDWDGEVPAGIDDVIRGESTILGTLTRTAVFGKEDLARVDAIRAGFRLLPLSASPAPRRRRPRRSRTGRDGIPRR